MVKEIIRYYPAGNPIQQKMMDLGICTYSMEGFDSLFSYMKNVEEIDKYSRENLCIDWMTSESRFWTSIVSVSIVGQEFFEDIDRDSFCFVTVLTLVFKSKDYYDAFMAMPSTEGHGMVEYMKVRNKEKQQTLKLE